MTLKHALPLIALVSALTATSIEAKTVYRWVDAQGNVEYSDQPRDGAKAIEVGPITTIVMPKGNETGESSFESESLPPTGVNPYVKLKIIKPASDEEFHSGSGNVEFQVSSEPLVSSPYQYQLSIDGVAVKTTSTSTFTVENIDRGTHNATVSVVDGSGKTVQQGESVSFTLHRPIIKKATPKAN